MPRLALTRLEDRQTPAILFATGSGGGIEAMVWLTLDHDPVESATAVVRPPSVFFPFPGFTGGVRVAMGDVTGDGTADVIAAAGAGGSPHIKVFDGLSGIEVRSFYAFDPVFTGGLSVASADNDRDGVCDIVVGADAGGGPHVQVFSGATGKVVRSFFAFAPTFSGGVAVSAADVNNDGFADVAVGAGTGGGPRVSLFDGYSGEVLQNFFAFDPTFTGGVSVAVADLAGDGDIQVVVGAGQNGGPRVRTFDLNGAEFGSFYAFDPGFLGGVNVAAADLDGDRLDDLIVGQASGGAAIRAFHGATTEQIFEQTQTGNGATAAGPLSSANGGTGAEDATDFPNIPVLDRLAVFNPDTGTFGRVTTGSIPSDKNIYVVSHGWAPGYKPWVDAYYKATGKILKVWQTAPNDPDYPTTNKFNTTGLPPAGGFLFDGMPPPSNTNGVVVSPAGLAAILAENDPNAVVLAFSWLDESATDGIISGVDSITGDVNVSEAHTTQNGIRLAQAIEQAIGSGNTSRIHLFGHSHGSKVVSVAAVELSDNGRAPTQVTIADSPEDALTQSFEAANFNWYFLQELNITRNPLGSSNGTFVDNYISFFGGRYSNLGPEGSPLRNIVDVVLKPTVIYPISILQPTRAAQNISASHTYAATWYAGTTNAGGDGGLAFSPLVNPVPNTPWDALSTQDWDRTTLDQQFQLATTEPYPPAVANTPVFTTIQFDESNITGSVTVSGGDIPTVTLSNSAGPAIWAGKFDPTTDATGIAFDYQFPNPGEFLTISIDGDLVFAIEGGIAGTVARTATLSTGNLGPVIFFDNVLTLSLTSTANPPAMVTLSNFRLLTV